MISQNISVMHVYQIAHRYTEILLKVNELLPGSYAIDI